MGGTSTKNLDYSGTNSNGSHNQGQDTEAPAEPVCIKLSFMFSVMCCTLRPIHREPESAVTDEILLFPSKLRWTP